MIDGSYRDPIDVRVGRVRAECCDENSVKTIISRDDFGALRQNGGKGKIQVQRRMYYRKILHSASAFLILHYVCICILHFVPVWISLNLGLCRGYNRILSRKISLDPNTYIYMYIYIYLYVSLWICSYRMHQNK